MCCCLWDCFWLVGKYDQLAVEVCGIRSKKEKLYLARKLIPGQECIAGMHLCVQYAGRRKYAGQRKVPEVRRPLPSMMDRPEIQGKWTIVLSELSD